MTTDQRYGRRIQKLLRTEGQVRRSLRVTLLLVPLLALWVFLHEFGVFSDPPANLFGIGMWAMIILSVYFWLRLRYVALLRWQSEHIAT